MKTLSAYVENKRNEIISEAVKGEPMPSSDAEMNAICSKNPLWKSIAKQAQKAGYKLEEAYNETFEGILLGVHVLVSPTRQSLPIMSANYPKGKGNMLVNIAGVGMLGGVDLSAWFKDMSSAVAFAQWIDKQDLSKLPYFENESAFEGDGTVIEADDPKKAPTTFEVAYKMFNKKGMLTTKIKAFKKDAARSKFVEKIKQDGDFYDIVGYREY